MKRILLTMEHYKPRLFVISLLFALPFILGSGCSTDTNREGIEALVGTTWKLTSIEAIDDSVFQQHENGIWEVPDDQVYSIEFKDEDELQIRADCDSCEAVYEIVSLDTLLIPDNYCYADVVCNKNLEFKDRLWATKTFEKDQNILHLYYNWAGMKGILHFGKTETKE